MQSFADVLALERCAATCFSSLSELGTFVYIAWLEGFLVPVGWIPSAAIPADGRTAIVFLTSRHAHIHLRGLSCAKLESGAPLRECGRVHIINIPTKKSNQVFDARYSPCLPSPFSSTGRFTLNQKTPRWNTKASQKRRREAQWSRTIGVPMALRTTRKEDFFCSILHVKKKTFRTSFVVFVSVAATCCTVHSAAIHFRRPSRDHASVCMWLDRRTWMELDAMLGAERTLHSTSGARKKGLLIVCW